MVGTSHTSLTFSASSPVNGDTLTRMHIWNRGRGNIGHQDNAAPVRERQRRAYDWRLEGSAYYSDGVRLVSLWMVEGHKDGCGSASNGVAARLPAVA
jgi:hypothetical protein